MKHEQLTGKGFRGFSFDIIPIRKPVIQKILEISIHKYINDFFVEITCVLYKYLSDF